jgi:hypothetical protein
MDVGWTLAKDLDDLHQAPKRPLDFLRVGHFWTIDQDRREGTIDAIQEHPTQVRQVWGCFWVEPEPHGFRQFAGGLGLLRMRTGGALAQSRPAPFSQSR